MSMFPVQLLPLASDERYYNRGQNEQVLENEARQVVSAGPEAPPDPQQAPLPGLSLYDMHRRPLPMVENRKITLDLKVLNQDFTCPICLGIIKDTMTTMDCMHRFCGECIITCLRVSNKECPTCRTKCQSKRNLRRDHAFDALIKAVYRDVAEVERIEQEKVVKIARSFDREAMRRTVEDGLRRQQANEAFPMVEDELAGLDHLVAPVGSDDEDFRPSGHVAHSQGGHKRLGRPPKASRPDEPKKSHKKKIKPAPAPGAPPPPRRKSQRVEILVERNGLEKDLCELALPALVVPREVTLAALCRLVLEYASLPGTEIARKGIDDVVFSLHAPLPSSIGVWLEPHQTVDELLSSLWSEQSGRLVLRYQTRVLAEGMGLQRPFARAPSIVDARLHNGNRDGIKQELY